MKADQNQQLSIVLYLDQDTQVLLNNIKRLESILTELDNKIEAIEDDIKTKISTFKKISSQIQKRLSQKEILEADMLSKDALLQ
jgi:DNA-binding protein H-NS